MENLDNEPRNDERTKEPKTYTFGAVAVMLLAAGGYLAAKTAVYVTTRAATGIANMFSERKKAKEVDKEEK